MGDERLSWKKLRSRQVSDDVKFWVLVRWTKVKRIGDHDQRKDDKVERVDNGTSVG